MKPMTVTLMTGLMLMAMTAKAEVKQGTQQLNLALGVANPLSSVNVDGERVEFGKVGPTFGAGYLYQLREFVSVGADLNFKRLGDKTVRTGHGTAEITSSAWTLLAVGRGDLMPANDIRPYALLGLGVGGVKREVRYDVGTAYNREQTSGSFAFAVAGGVDFDINPSWLAGAELRYNYIRTREYEVGTDSVKTLDLAFKVGYKF